MKKMFVAIAIALLVLGCLGAGEKKNEGSNVDVKITSDSGSFVFVSAEVADTPQERAVGLMFRESLPQSQGMLFIFEDEAPRSFWMKNTLIPLDMIFMDGNGTVVGVVENALPCKNDPCRGYSSGKAAKYVLEVNANFSRENRISEGNAASFAYE